MIIHCGVTTLCIILKLSSLLLSPPSLPRVPSLFLLPLPRLSLLIFLFSLLSCFLLLLLFVATVSLGLK
ncbi:hypothetical protein CSUI_007789 [Cystoisospora suis]|uniref:Transmembrane protein n=1 Tax=Cystoisospora suis TaxID=483139 RepID=A0A2C6KPI0_9APIC|nr:hypothetical protein CSUI_007789 [Cystoisospora suis]